MQKIQKRYKMQYRKRNNTRQIHILSAFYKLFINFSTHLFTVLTISVILQLEQEKSIISDCLAGYTVSQRPRRMQQSIKLEMPQGRGI